MLFRIAGGVTGSYVALRVIFSLFPIYAFFEYPLDGERIGLLLILLFLLILMICLGLIIGEGISSLVGHFLPQKSEENTYRIGSIQKKTHVENRVVSQGEGTRLEPHVYTSYHYTIWDGQGGYHSRSIRTYLARVVFHDRQEMKLVIKTYFFPQKWWNWLASPSGTGYTFYVPKGRDII